MKNNKLTRKRAAVLAAKQSQSDPNVAGTLDSGVEVLKSRESRAKVRRWSFEADIELVFPKLKNEDGTEQETPAISGMKRTMKLETISYSSAKDALESCKAQEEQLRKTSPLFANSKLRVRAIPHETVSNTTVNQMSGYRDMAMILDNALALAITEAQDVVTGKAVGSQFIEAAAVPGVPAQGDIPAVQGKPERSLAVIKEEFYKRAMDQIKAKMQENSDAQITDNGSGTQAPTSSEGCVGEPEPESFEQLKERMLSTEPTASDDVDTQGQVSA